MYVVRRRQSIPVRKESIKAVNETSKFTVNDSPDFPDAEPEVLMSETKAEIEPPDEHAPVPEPIKKTEVQKTFLDDLGGFA